MSKVRGPAWWYEFRYGDTRPVALAIAGIGVLFVIGAATGVPEWMAERHRASAAACVEHGGHIVLTGVRGNVPVCEGL